MSAVTNGGCDGSQLSSTDGICDANIVWFNKDYVKS